MKYAITSSCHIDNISAKSFVCADGGAILTFGDMPLKTVALHVPAHVAKHTAAAFNRAMQAVPVSGGYQYGDWRISQDDAKGTVWLAQHDEVTGDQDPHWLFADGNSLLDAMDAVDTTVEEHSCTRCGDMVGDDHLTQTGGAEYLCDTCHEDMSARREAMHEMAQDDKAHAQREMRAGL